MQEEAGKPGPAGAGSSERYEYVILTDHCMGCGARAWACPRRAVVDEHTRSYVIDHAKCAQVRGLLRPPEAD